MWRDVLTVPLSEPQSRMLDRVVAALGADDRFDPLLGGGSLVTGGFDTQSALDLAVVRADAHVAVMAERTPKWNDTWSTGSVSKEMGVLLSR